MLGGAGNAVANYGAGKVVGSVVGRDVQSINANFFVESHMQNEIRSSAVSQAFVSTGSAAIGAFVSATNQLANNMKKVISAQK